MSNNDSGFTKKNVGLALGSGSARGWSHIGVLRALDEAGLEIRYVADQHWFVGRGRVCP